MTNKQSAAYVFSQSICALAKIAGMAAKNQQHLIEYEEAFYDESDFEKVIEEYSIHHNGVMTVFNEWVTH